MNIQIAAALCKKHEELGWPGLIGSLDCSHWEWAKCPVSLHGDFKKGNKERPSIAYECACDSDLSIWHCFFALPGACSDINVLDQSPLLFDIGSGNTMSEFRTVDGTLLNQPYVLLYLIILWLTILTFHHVWLSYYFRYLLVDGIYPEWTCFLGPISNPKTASEKHYTAVQASRRKDIERAFGALKYKWHILNKPSLTPDITLMNRILRVCVILHNMVKTITKHRIYTFIVYLGGWRKTSMPWLHKRRWSSRERCARSGSRFYWTWWNSTDHFDSYLIRRLFCLLAAS